MAPPVQRGDVFWANLDPTIGVEIQKTRPVVVMPNDVINQRSQLVIVVPLTTSVTRLSPSHVLIPRGEGGLTEDSNSTNGLSSPATAIAQSRCCTSGWPPRVSSWPCCGRSMWRAAVY